MITTIRSVWSLFVPSQRRRTLVMLALIVLMAMAEAVGVLSIMPFLTVLGRPEIVHENAWLSSGYHMLGATGTREFTVMLGLVSMCVVVLSSAFKALTLHLVSRFVHMQRHSLSARLLSRYLGQPYEFFLERNPSELAKNVLSEVDHLTFDLLQPLSLLIAHATVVVTMLVVVVVYDPLMAFGIAATIGLLYAGIYLLVRRRMVRIGRARQTANAARYKACNEALGGIKDVKVTHTADTWLGGFVHNSREFSRHSAAAETMSTSPLYIVEAVGYSGLVLIALFLLAQSDDIAQVLPALGLYGFAAYRLLPAVQIMYRGLTRLRFSASVLENIQRDLALPEVPATAGSDILRPRREIRLCGIRYAYPSTPESPVLTDFDLTISANTSIGIAGRSGTGKSTLMDILLGLLQPQAGLLAVDDVPVTPENVRAWQRAIGYVPQHVYLSDASVAENIAFGVPAHEIDRGAVERAARAAQIHDFVTRELSHGYDTRVGDRGVRLSGGQRQRIGIARALYRDPPVLLFDEATSALDSETEDAVNQAVTALARKKTVVVIAHRASSLASCDTVVQLQRRREERTP